MLAGLDGGAGSGLRLEGRPQTRGARVASRLFNGLSRFVSGIELHDVNCGLKAFRRRGDDEVPLYGELHRFIPLLAAGQGFRVTRQAVAHRRAPSAVRATAGRARSGARWT